MAISRSLLDQRGVSTLAASVGLFPACVIVILIAGLAPVETGRREELPSDPSLSISDASSSSMSLSERYPSDLKKTGGIHITTLIIAG
jgi:hypothetical protein